MDDHGTDGALVRVLVVDDDPALADVIADYLERRPGVAAVETETRVRAALPRLDAEPFDCVVSDQRMPGTDGVEFCRHVRAERPRLPFFLLTGLATDAVLEAAIRAGVSDVVEKGAGTETYERLYDRIAAVARRKRVASGSAKRERPAPSSDA